MPPSIQSVIGEITLERPSEVRVLVKNGFNNARASVSPNGRWIAYESTTSGRAEIYVERYPELGNRQQISTSGGRDARWSADGRELYFATEDGKQMFVVPVQTGTSLEPGRPRVLFEVAVIPIVAGDQAYDIATDGRFFVIRPEDVEDGTPSIVLVQNWTEELKRLVPND